MAVLVVFVELIEQLDNEHANVGGLFWLLFGRWAVLPIVSALPFAAAYRQQQAAKWGTRSAHDEDRSRD